MIYCDILWYTVVYYDILAVMWLSADTIDKWDEDKLKEVVEKKHGDKNKPRTDIVSLGEHSLAARARE